MGYIGQATKEIALQFGCALEIIKRPRKWFWVPTDAEVGPYLQARGMDTSAGFKILPRRWVVERTFAWINRYRRLSKDYEFLCETSEAFLFLAMTRTMLNRLKKLIF